MHRRAYLAAAGAALVPAVAGCLGDGGGGTGGTASPTPAGSPTPTADPGGTSARERYPDYAWELLDDAEPVATDAVTMRNATFEPLAAAVVPGTTVTFENADSFGHTVTIPALDIDEPVDGGGSATVTVEPAGTYDYVCTLHPPDMLGRLEVTDDLPSGTPTATGTPTPTGDGDGGGYYRAGR